MSVRVNSLAGLALAVLMCSAGSASAADLLRAPAPVVIAAPGRASDNPWAEMNVGVYYGEPNSYGAYVGFLFSPQRDIWAEGLLLRADFGAGRYLYTGNAFVDAEVVEYNPSILLGWRHNFQGGHLTLFGGLDYNYTDHPDSAATPNGSEWGGKAIADFGIDLGNRFNYEFYGNISSIRTRYYAQARLGYSPGGFKFGPELVALGGSSDHNYRFGGFVSFDRRTFQLSFAAGNQWNDSGDSTGLYAGANLAIRFR